MLSSLLLNEMKRLPSDYTGYMQDVKRIREVLELIVCPACHGHLSMAEGSIACASCGRRYPVEDGIPVLLVERATAPR